MMLRSYRVKIIAILFILITLLFIAACSRSEDGVQEEPAERVTIEEEPVVQEPAEAEPAERVMIENYTAEIYRLEIVSGPNSTAEIEWDFLEDGSFVFNFTSMLDDSEFTRSGTWYENDGYIYADFNSDEPVSLEALFQNYGTDRTVIFSQTGEFSVRFPIYEEGSDIWGVYNNIEWYKIAE